MMTGCIVGTFLTAAAATPLPVNVENWPSPPGPDSVALDTLKYARWAFWATVIVGLVTAIGTAFAFVDYLLNMRQFRRPQLVVTLWERYPKLNFAPYVPPLGDEENSLSFVPELQLNNDGKRSTAGCFVSIWIPRPFKFDPESLRPWKTFTIGEGFRDKPGQTYDRIETYIVEPVFIEHPLVLPRFGIVSPTGEAEIEMRWQVFFETGKNPSGEPGYLHCGVKIMSGRGVSP